MHFNLSFQNHTQLPTFDIMKAIDGIDALRLATEISKLPDGCFTIGFFKYNSSKDQASDKLTILERCQTRTQLPQDIFSRDSENFFLFQDEEGNPKTAYRILIRFIGFPDDGFELRKINWLK